MSTRKPVAEYYQELLHTLSYVDKRIFLKELRKAFRRMMPEERAQLKGWFRSACVCRVDREHGLNGSDPLELAPAKLRAGS